MWVIGRMTLHQAVVARLMGQNKPKQLISILIQKAKDTAAAPTTQYYVSSIALKILKVVRALVEKRGWGSKPLERLYSSDAFPC
jgi:hypothetical protein